MGKTNLKIALAAWQAVRDRHAADGQRHCWQLHFTVFQPEAERKLAMERAETQLIATSGLDPEQHGVIWYRLPDEPSPGIYIMQAEMLTKDWCEKWAAAEVLASLT